MGCQRDLLYAYSRLRPPIAYHFLTLLSLSFACFLLINFCGLSLLLCLSCPWSMNTLLVSYHCFFQALLFFLLVKHSMRVHVFSSCLPCVPLSPPHNRTSCCSLLPMCFSPPLPYCNILHPAFLSHLCASPQPTPHCSLSLASCFSLRPPPSMLLLFPPTLHVASP